MNIPRSSPKDQHNTVHPSISGETNRSYDSRWESYWSVEPISNRNPFIAGGPDFTEKDLLEITQDRSQLVHKRIIAAGMISLCSLKKELLHELKKLY